MTSSMNFRFHIPAVPLFFLTYFLFVSGPAISDTLHIAVASNFILPIKQLSKNFEEETGHKIKTSFGSSGKLYAQIKHGAPFDLLLSADLLTPKKLVNEKVALAKSLVIYAKGQLALWSKTTIEARTPKEILLDAKRIAIANPRLAPYGKAAQEILQKFSLWQDVQNKLVRGENIGQTYQFVHSKNADVGLIALSQTLHVDKEKEKITLIPQTFYNTINQGAVILSRTKNKQLAESFMAFLIRVDTQAQIAQFGYSTKNN